jgi:hypothetical protein
MTRPFVGSEARASGALTRYQLRSRFVALYPDVYIPPDTELTAIQRTYAAWLWSKRRGIVAGQSASAVHRAKWVDDTQPAQLLYDCRRPPKDIVTWSDQIPRDETQLINGVRVTTPARTAFDLACRYSLRKAVAAIDALARATRLKTVDAELIADRQKGQRNIRRAHRALSRADAGAESPRETWLRLLVIEAGYPPQQTQIPIYGPYGELVGIVDMGWENLKIAPEYEGDHHRTSRRIFNSNIARHETMTTDLGWAVIRVTVEDVPGGVLQRLGAAWSRRTCSEGEKIAGISPSEHVGRY